ncbi:MAG: hypothetical protein FD123_3349 [Bacteroidetes bacterium]|nr:MAG: hypothetical protein FD123_3349 [Bacteroidota bacterium]
MDATVKTFSRNLLIHGNPHSVFSFMDDLAKTGMHMTKRSMMMMGSKLTLEDITNSGTGVGSTFRWYGKMMGMKMDFTETVTEWVADKSKKWETISDAKVILFSWYQMGFELESKGKDTEATLWIKYKKPKGWFYRLLSVLFAKWYCRWCLENMLGDTKKHVEPENKHSK